MRRSNLARKPTGDVKTKYFRLKGGLNLVDAPMDIPQGMLLGGVNYELLTRDGLRRLSGYERFDGQASPSDASYWILDFDTGTDIETPFSAPEIGATAQGGTSGATGEVGLVVTESGSFELGTAVGYIVLFNVSGTFASGEAITFTGADDGFDSGFSAGFG